MGRRAIALALAVGLLSVGAAPASRAATNDPLFGEQWGLHRVRAEAAWRTATGTGTTIAVVDSGVDLLHEDLKGKVVAGADFVDGGSPTDAHGHGTFVSGIAAAATGNGKGIAGTAPAAKILAVRVLDRNARGSLADLVDGVRWAADQGAEVVNLSIIDDGSPLLALVPEFDDAVYYAFLKGAVVVVSAGNDGGSTCRSPAFSPYALCVGATDSADRLASFSNRGLRLDVVAPGAGVRSTAWYASRPSEHHHYGTGSGTSFAAPFVSGVAAMLRGMGATNVQAMKAIRCSARDLGPSGYDLTYGWGLVDAEAAVRSFRSGSYLLGAC